jgi:hypothetical protein
MVIIRFTARWLRTLHQFAAADPWNGNRPAQFTMEEYVMMPSGVQKAVDSDRFAHRIGIRSSVGGEHMLPESLVALWRNGQVRLERIPALTKAIEPRLLKEDFNLILHRRSIKNDFVIPLIVVFFLILVVMGLGTRSEGHFSLPLALFISAAMTLVTGGILWMMRQTARKRRAEQMKWFLDAESGVAPVALPGRARTLLKRFAIIYAVFIALTLVIAGGVMVWMH